MEIVVPYAHVVLINPCSLWQIDIKHSNVFNKYLENRVTYGNSYSLCICGLDTPV